MTRPARRSAPARCPKRRPRACASQAWWAPDDEAKAVLFGTALDAMKFLGVPEAFAVLRDGESLPALPAKWKESGRQSQVRLVKE